MGNVLHDSVGLKVVDHSVKYPDIPEIVLREYWDSEGKLVFEEVNDEIIQYKYDAFGRETEVISSTRGILQSYTYSGKFNNDVNCMDYENHERIDVIAKYDLLDTFCEVEVVSKKI